MGIFMSRLFENEKTFTLVHDSYLVWKISKSCVDIDGFLVLKLTIYKKRFAIHFDNFVKRFYLIFLKSTNQSLIVKLSFNFKHK